MKNSEHKAAIRKGNMDYTIARHHKDKKNHGSVSFLKFIGIKRVKPNPLWGSLTNREGNSLGAVNWTRLYLIEQYLYLICP